MGLKGAACYPKADDASTAGRTEGSDEARSEAPEGSRPGLSGGQQYFWQRYLGKYPQKLNRRFLDVRDGLQNLLCIVKRVVERVAVGAAALCEV